jgi:hypothetical protein
MPSIITAGTTTGTALSLTSDTSGELQIRTNNGSTTAMTLTTAGNVGVGNTSPGAPLDVTSNSNAFGVQVRGRSSDNVGILRFVDNTVSAEYFRFEMSSSGSILSTVVSAPMIFRTSNTERMRIDSSGNVGIGTSSPGATKLAVQTAGGAVDGLSVYSPSVTNGAIIRLADNNYNAALRTIPAGGTTNLAFDVAGAERMRITSTGVVALNNPVNITQTLWSGAPAYQAGQSAAFYGDGQVANWVSGHALNAYRSANTWYYSSTGIPSGRVEYGNGATGAAAGFAVYGADAGSAGGAITWTQTLNVSTGTTLALQGATSQSGTGITFPATQNASSNANTLDDYEEGTWTATLSATTTAPTTPVTTTGYYTKIGNLVTVFMRFTNVNTTGAVGNMRITGMPFAAANNTENQSNAPMMFGLNVPNLYVTGFVQAGQTEIRFLGIANNGAWSDVTLTAGTSKYLNMSLTYQTST